MSPDEYQVPILPSTWNVPYQRNPFFTGREDVLKHLHDRLRTLTQPQAISGLGGMGKTQTALEYTYRYRDDYQVILWAKANSRETIISDFVKIAGLLNLPEQSAGDQKLAVNAVKRWLEQHSNWLLILDNADDLKMIQEFTPSEGKGSILLTTRAQATGSIAQRLEIEQMAIEEGVVFLLRRASIIRPEVPFDKVSLANRSKAREITQALDGLPLALDQAGAYIQENEISLSDYLDIYQIERIALLEERGEFDAEHPEPVATTWSVSFEKVRQANPAAADLLRTCAFLAPVAIPLEIITEGASELGAILAPIATKPLTLNDAIKELLKYSLIHRDPDTKTLRIHRLVQAVVEDRMEQEARHQWAERTVRAVLRAFPVVDFKTWQRCERCLPHAQSCKDLIRQWNMEFPEAAELLYKAGRYLHERAQYKEAKPLYEFALAIRENVLGSHHPDTATSLHYLAWLYYDLGQYKQAKPFDKRALTIRERVLGPNHPDTAWSLNNLARLYKTQGKYERAQPLYQRALDIREKVLEPDHPDTATSLNNLAVLYYAQGQYEQAKSFLERVFSIKEKALGLDHPDTATSLNNLAVLYSIQGQYEQAELLFHRALAIREKVLGPDHPDIAQSLNNLADLHYAQGKYEQAEPLYQRALAIYQQALGPDHPDTATSLNSLAVLYYTQGKYEQAEPLYQRALAIYQQALGPDHPNTATSLNNLADLYSAQGRYEQAQSLYQRALAIRENVLGPDHPDTATSLNSLANFYYAQGKYEQAEPLYQCTLAIYEQTLGPEHLDAAGSLNSLAVLYYTQGKYEQAEPLYQRALAIWEKTLGPEHSNVASGLENYAALLRKTNRETQAEELEARVRAIRAKNR